MLEFIGQLKQRYQAVLDSGTLAGDATNALRESLSSLVLAEASIRKLQLVQQYPDHPRQIVVIGPTQVGKSSITNLLLAKEMAEASHVAGFTVHCQGFLVSAEDTGARDGERVPDAQWAHAYFSGLSQRQQEQLDRQALNEYSLRSVVGGRAEFAGCVVWDTPDFDSVESFSYREPVLRAAALADVVLFVVSKEKYADKTVWQMLGLLHELGVPLIVAMNKTAPPVRAELQQSFEDKFQRMAPDSELPAIRFIDEYANGELQLAATTDEFPALLESVLTPLKTGKKMRDAELRQVSTQAFLQQHWSQWVAPVVDEHSTRAQWQALVDEVCAATLVRYQAEYLDHARYRETFQLALAELLALLEVPGMAEPLTKLRGLVTWPMRKLMAAARDGQAQPSEKHGDQTTQELRLLQQLGDHALSRMASESAKLQTEDVGAGWWIAASGQLAHRQEQLKKDYESSLENYQAMLKVEIERAAQSLYKKLQEQPATLNGLRAARVSADAAAVVLAVKSGGLGLADLVIAPAMLSLTTMLTEGALGQYMEKVQSDLRTYQRREVKELVRRKLRNPLYRVPRDTDMDSRFNVSEKALLRAQELLEAGKFD